MDSGSATQKSRREGLTMAEYIKRDAALRVAHTMRPEDKRLEITMANIPTVDAVPVVRCKDCEHYSGSSSVCNLYLHFSIAVKPDDFCSHGERRG